MNTFPQQKANDVRDKSRQFAMIPFDVIESIDDAKALALYCVLKKYAHHSTNIAHPSRARLAQKIGYKTTRPVDEALEVLRDSGLVRTFPRYRDEHGNIGYEQNDQFRERTSNGYELYDTPVEKDVPLWPVGHNPYSPQATTPIAHRPQELYPSELEPRELDKRHDHPKDDRFNEFWEVVPKKVGKQAARKAWVKAIKATDPDVIIAGMKRYRDDPNRSDAFTKNPQGWLNDGRWEDDPLPDRSTTTSGKKANTVENWLGLPEGSLDGRNPFSSDSFADPYAGHGTIDGTVIEQKELY